MHVTLAYMDPGGGGIGPFELLIILVLVGIPLLLVFTLVRHIRSRPCLACGKAVKRGRTVCAKCGHQFAAQQ